MSLPTVNALVRLEVREGEYLASRVEGIDDDVYSVAMPSYGGDLEPPEPGDPLFMVWTSQRGLYAIPAEYVAKERHRVGTWRIRVAGEVETKQRRRFVRVQMTGTVTLVVDAPGAAVEAHLADLSEGGLRCLMARGAVATDVRDLPVTVRLPAEEDAEPLEVPGHIVRVRPGPTDRDEAVVVFEPDPPLLDAVRAMAMKEQLRQRRAERELVA